MGAVETPESNLKPNVSVTLVKFDATYFGTGRTLMFDLKGIETFYTSANVHTFLKLRCDRQKT
jgi:hypothetical protein